MKRIILSVLLTIVTVVLSVFCVMRLRHPLPAKAAAQTSASIEKEWWMEPPALTPDEVAAQQWLADITYRLSPEQEDEFWAVGGSQHGNFSIRYQAAFAGYAASALGMRTPAYVGLTGRVISNAVARVADRKAWGYIRSYWKDEPWFPDPCARGNVMYTGHLMMLMALHEALSGERTFNSCGVDLVWDATNRFNYTSKRLAEITARQIMEGDGGITCEPGLVFFACNNHPHVTFRLLEGMGYGDWRSESRKWEAWALAGLRATAGGGAFRLVHHEKSGLSLPRGLPGYDGWCLLWYSPWASVPENLPRLWRLARNKLDWSEFEGEPREEPESVDVSDCCNPVKVPSAATASFLAAAARACKDDEIACKLEAWLDRHFLQEAHGRLWLGTHKEWRIGASANRFIALAQANGSELRPMVRRPLPRTYFDGLMLESVLPDDTPVYQAYRNREGTLHLEIDGAGKSVNLRLRNAGSDPQFEVDGNTRWNWDAAERSLKLEACNRIKLKISRIQGK
ncbi:MAG: hypothetical protein PHU80_06710 [Kiritimatiellae bacterium]|nr:hypothetical protein [Kiritimatiellia bacterium]